MAYEHRIYIVRKGDYLSGDCYDKCYSKILAVFNLGRAEGVSGFLERLPESRYYVTEGDTDILTDMYGRSLTEISVGDLLYGLQESNKRQYWKGCDGLGQECLTLMEALEPLTVDGSIICLHYGY